MLIVKTLSSCRGCLTLDITIAFPIRRLCEVDASYINKGKLEGGPSSDFSELRSREK